MAYNNWGHGSQEEKPQIENLDNYNAAIDKAKSDLSDINCLIEDAKKRKDDIESNNQSALQAKLIDLEAKLKEAADLSKAANELHSVNTLSTEEIENRHQNLMKGIADLDTAKRDHLKYVQDKERLIAEEWERIHKLLAEISTTNLDLDTKSKSNADELTKIFNEHAANKETLAKILAKSNKCDEMTAQVNAKLEEIKKLSTDSDIKIKEANVKIDEATKRLQESSDVNTDAEQKLKEVIKTKEDIKDLIIESKKSKFEANRDKESAQKIIADSNQKLAELKQLRESLAK